MMNGLEERLCGNIGIMLQTFRLGYIIEPPADNEYAVDQVGVEIINPSALSSKMS